MFQSDNDPNNPTPLDEVAHTERIRERIARITRERSLLRRLLRVAQATDDERRRRSLVSQEAGRA
jgi:hypothetical protein